jgi:anti-sigma factor RsiW
MANVSAANHPSESVLAVWLETGDPTSVESHLETCDECAARLETLTDLGSLQEELATVTNPPSGLADRTTAGVKGRLAAQEAVSVVVDMLTLPFRTAGVLIGGDPAPARVTTTGAPNDETADDDGERHDG